MGINSTNRIQVLIGVILSVLAGVSLYAYSSNLEARYEDEAKRTFAYFVVREVPEGTLLSDVLSNGFVESREVLSQSLPTSALNSSSQGNSQTLFSRRDIPVGQLLIQDDFGTTQLTTSGLLIPDGDVVVSIRLQDIERISPFLRPGNDVAVFATSSSSQSGDISTRAIVPRAKVLGIGDTRYIGGQDFLPSGDSSIITLAVEPSQATVLIQASKTHALHLALITERTTVPQGLVSQRAVLGKS